MKITLIKKILEDGSECKKCREVSERLTENNEMDRIDHIVFADVRDAESEGFKLAEKFNIEVAPFFIVENEGEEKVYTSYMQLRKQVFNAKPDDKDAEIEEKRQQEEDPNEDMYWM